MTVYDRAVQTALRMLTKYGQAVTLRAQSSGAYNTSTGSVTVTETTQAAIGAEFDYGAKDIDGTLIQSGDKQLYLSPLKADGSALTPPAVDDTATVNGVTYTIKNIKTLAPGGTAVLYDCNLRV